MTFPSQRRIPVWPWISFLFLLVLRLAWLNAYTLNSDEAQHAHVAWAWTQGLLPYRDVFDNHGPLFSWLHSPLLRWLDNRPDVLTWLRLAMQFWYVVALGAAGRIAQRLYGWRTAMAVVLVAGLFPRFFIVSGQFRTDDMWMAMWLLGLAFVAGAPPRLWRYFLAGLAFGCALSVSQKTLVLLVTTVVAAGIVRVLRPADAPRAGVRCWLVALAGLLVVPAIFTAWLAAHGVLGDAWYGLAGYNMGGASKRHAAQQGLWFILLAVALIAVCLRMARQRSEQGFDWPVFFMLQGGLYLFLIWFIWPLITKQDFLPVLPTLVIAVTGWASGWTWLDRRHRLRAGLLVFIVTAELATIVAYAPPWEDSLAEQRSELATVLRYTDETDTVMDAKGDSIFRMRPYYPVLESLAMRRLRRGQMVDTIVDDMINHRTMVALIDRLPPASARFVMLNYMEAGGSIWVAGRVLPDHQPSQTFDVKMPGDYVVTDGHRRLSGSMDGGPVADHWLLERGTHHLVVNDGTPVAFVWSQAFDRGWRPAPPATGG
ncbi:hypothetical protein SAMN04487785_113120 [Dyella jiangningensis]|uniref:ArnT family glycosyltransferase n=1 Tax=Dyella sp. AtDHG13 TaxID=1938897 RepID=UPI00088FA58F|nr:hypothetical protein [Dyella sp. AtDHG13]PXV60789.1 hypothetical protein BDW41_102517 [Dyella sp. AtDHG13]SDK97941.1 hypothetical protein SAMN04487785_113120 [Dyella jiangningensis]